MIVLLNKPYGVLCQFTPDGSPNRTLADFFFPPGVYSIGRLDAVREQRELERVARPVWQRPLSGKALSVEKVCDL